MILITSSKLFLTIAALLFLISAANPSKENSSKCNPDTRHLFGKFLMKSWSDARKELGLLDPFAFTNRGDEERFSFKIAVERVVLKFFNYNTGALVYYKDWQPVPYIRLYNSGDGAITSTLDSICRSSSAPPGKFIQPIFQVAKSQSQLDLLVSTFQSALNSSAQIPSFTVVSDPVSRFISGYEDSIARLYSRSSEKPKINSTTIKKHMEILLEYEQPVPASYQNLYPMAGAFFDFFIDILAQKDSLKEDWTQLICPAYGSLCQQSIPSSPTASLRRKNSVASATIPVKLPVPRVDEHGVQEALQDLFSSSPQYLRAICHLLLVDYVCLPSYALPPQCQYLSKTRDAAREALEKRLEIPYEIPAFKD